MSEHICPDPRELGSVLTLPPEHPDRQAAEACPLCEATLLSYHSFLAAAENESEHYGAAESTALDGMRAQLAGGATRARRRPRPFAPAMLPAWGLAAAACLLAVMLWRGDGTSEVSTALRGAEELAELPHLALQADGAWQLSWEPAPNVDGYALQILGSDLTELERRNLGDVRQHRLLPAELVAWQSAGPLLVRVLGLRGQDIIWQSRTILLAVGAASNAQ